MYLKSKAKGVNALPCHSSISVCLWIVDLDSRLRVMSLMASFCAVLFPTRCLGWDLELNWVSFWGFSFLLLENAIEHFVQGPCCQWRSKQQLEIMMNSWPRGYNIFFMLIQLSMKFFLLINVKMPTFVGILSFRNRKNSTIGLSEPQKTEMLGFF